MVRRLLGFAAGLLALPALLAAQTPRTPATGAVHGKATQFLGEVVRPAAQAARTVGDIDHNQADGDKVEDQKDAKEGPDVDEGPDVKEGPDVAEDHNDAAQSQGEGDEQNESGDTPPRLQGRRLRSGVISRNDTVERGRRNTGRRGGARVGPSERDARGRRGYGPHRAAGFHQRSKWIT